MRVLGAGLVCAQGRSKEAFVGDPLPATFVEVSFQKEAFPVFSVSAETLKDKTVLGTMRRADRFSKMATIAAYDAIADAEAKVSTERDRIGIIFATAFGPHNTTFKFQDDIIDYGDGGVSPTVFSNSVHNAAVSYISRTLGIKGPTWTITTFLNPFKQAITLAEAWLAEGRCDQVLIGAGDECGTVMEYICSEKLPIAIDGKIRLDNPSSYVPGEGVAFFLVDGQEDGEQLTFPQESMASFFGNMLTGEALESAAYYFGGSIKNEA